MIKTIISAVLGFGTLPAAVLCIFLLIEFGGWINQFDLPVPPYWGGLFLLVGFGIIALCVVVGFGWGKS